jgi:hypothetical protein
MHPKFKRADEWSRDFETCRRAMKLFEQKEAKEAKRSCGALISSHPSNSSLPLLTSVQNIPKHNPLVSFCSVYAPKIQARGQIEPRF